MRGEEHTASEAGRVMQVLDHCLGDGDAIVGGRPPSDLVQHHQTARRGVPQDIGRLDHRAHEGADAASEVVIGADGAHSSVARALGSAAHGHETQAVELKGAKAARVVVHMPSGQLSIQGGAAGLMDAEFYQGAAWSAPAVDYHVDNGFGTLTIDQQSASQFVGNSENTWKLKLTNEVPLELEIDVGAGRGDLNLSKIDLTRMQLNVGAGQANVDLTGERGKDLQAQIHGGVGEAIVRLPKSIGVGATVHGGLGSIDVHGLKEEDGQYVNAAYGKSPQTLRLTVEGGIGHIKLEQE